MFWISLLVKKVFECEVLEHNLGKFKEFYVEHAYYIRLAKSDIWLDNSNTCLLYILEMYYTRI